jgi:hypothetical protein
MALGHAYTWKHDNREMTEKSYCNVLDILHAHKHIFHYVFIFWLNTELDYIKAWVKHIDVPRRVEKHDPLTTTNASIALHDKPK